MHIGRRNMDSIFSYSLMGRQFKKVDDEKNIGVTRDSNLTNTVARK